MSRLGATHAWFYAEARAWIESSAYAQEIAWTETLEWSEFSEPDFLREAAWVVLCSGFKEAIVRRKFGSVSFAYFDWHSAQQIASDGDSCVQIAVQHFGNRKKLQAIVGIAEAVATQGFRKFKARLMRNPVETLEALPFVGPVTSLHLAKNLGLGCVKPDRHLVRLADMLGFEDVVDMCFQFAEQSGDGTAVVDTVLWRYCEQRRAWQ